nr:DHHC zinc finger domain containing protein [Haemonchus contortus]
MAFRFLIGMNRSLAKFGDLVTHYGGCVFLVFMLLSVFYVGLKLSCYSTEQADHCDLIANFGVVVALEIIMNLVLFQYYSRNNCVSHWQRQACVAGLCRTAISIDELACLEEDEDEFGLVIGARYTAVYLYQTSSESFPLGFIYCIGPVAVIRWIIGYAGFLHAFVCTVFSFMIASIVAAGAFFVMQIYYTSYGYTMYEYHSSVRDAFDGDGNTLGERFRLIFGRYWLLNFLFPLCWNPQLLTAEIATNLFRVRSKQL